MPVGTGVLSYRYTGMLSNQWTVEEFYPIEYLPRGVRLTAYGGGANDLPPDVLSDFLEAVERGDATVPIAKVFELVQIGEAHQIMEDGTAAGKLVVANGHTTDPLSAPQLSPSLTVGARAAR